MNKGTDNLTAWIFDMDWTNFRNSLERKQWIVLKHLNPFKSFNTTARTIYYFLNSYENAVLKRLKHLKTFKNVLNPFEMF